MPKLLGRLVSSLFLSVHKSSRQLLSSLCVAVFTMQPAILLSQDATQSANQVENLILITLDGLRSEELFRGAEKPLMTKEHGVDKPDELVQDYWRETPIERREVLLPFLWSQFNSSQGWVAGDIERDSVVVIGNERYFSYPGYNEILTGIPDKSIDSNAKKYNENVTFLEWLQNKPAYRDRVAAFCSWDVFPFIINDRRSGIYVNAGWQPFTIGEPAALRSLNIISDQLFRQFNSVRYDSITMSGALEYLHQKSPRVLFVSIGETDDWAHQGRYDRYLLTARQNDALIRILWETCQAHPQYKDKTVFLLSSDHGRGIIRDGWKSHGDSLPGSERSWVAAFGPGLLVNGNDSGNQYSLSQVAPTACALLGEKFTVSKGETASPLPIVTLPSE